MRRAAAAAVLSLGLVVAACSDGAPTGVPSTTTPATGPSSTKGPAASGPTTAVAGSVRLEVTEVARGLEVPWALAWDPSGALWFTQRTGALTKLGSPPREVAGVSPSGEGGLTGLEIDRQGRMFVMYTSASDNRIVRLESDGSQKVLVSGIVKAAIHDAGRLRFGPDGTLYASTGDAGQPDLAPDASKLNGKVLKVDPDKGGAMVFTKGHRNPEGLCFASDGRFLATEHGPTGNDEINVLRAGFDGGWPGTSGNGIKNYPSSVAPAGCAVYGADLIPQWKGSMLFGTLRGQSLRRLSFNADGSVAAEEVLYENTYGRIRDVAVGPDGAVYFTTSNRDGRGSVNAGDDKILKIAPAR